MKLLMWSLAHVNDRVLELTAGSRLAIRVIFAAMSRQFVPSAAEGFDGSICYELRRHKEPSSRAGPCASRRPRRWRRLASRPTRRSRSSSPSATSSASASERSRRSLCSPRRDSSSTVISRWRPGSPRCSGDRSLNPDPARPDSAGRLRHPREFSFVSTSHCSGVPAEA